MGDWLWRGEYLHVTPGTTSDPRLATTQAVSSLARGASLRRHMCSTRDGLASARGYRTNVSGDPITIGPPTDLKRWRAHLRRWRPGHILYTLGTISWGKVRCWEARTGKELTKTGKYYCALAAL